MQPALVIDIETSSAHDIDFGAWAYSQHPSTIVYVLCWLLVDPDGAPVKGVWRPGDEVDRRVQDHLRRGRRLVAHNAAFEQAIWSNILIPRYGWPQYALGQWFDTQTLGLSLNMPHALEGLGLVLGCKTQKDVDVGGKLMRAMAKAEPDGEGGWAYDRDPEHLRVLTEYCHDDVAVTAEIYHKLEDAKLPKVEEQLIAANARINTRGVYLNQRFAHRCAELAHRRAGQLERLAWDASEQHVYNATNTPQLKAWCEEMLVPLPKVRKKNSKGKQVTVSTLDRNAVASLLAEDAAMPPQIRRVLELRVEANKATSLSKLARVPHMVGHDGRLRHALRIYGAHTGRWTSSGLQLHNLPKDKMSPLEADCVRHAISDLDLNAFDLGLFDVSPLEGISQSLRSIVAAPPGRELIAADYSAIEARVIAWLAGQHDILAQFAAGTDVYMYTAEGIGSDSRQLGKICVLALGFGMGALRFAVQAASWGVPISLKDARKIQRAWRESNDQIVAFWYDLENAVFEVIAGPPNSAVRVGKLVVFRRPSFLGIRLPSGRVLRYWRPSTRWITKKYQVVNDEGVIETIERTQQEIRFFTVGKDHKSMAAESTYSGKLAENVTQAIARDLLAAAVVRFDLLDGYDLVMHVHDSLAAEVDAGTGDVDEFCEIMAECPAWADGLPIAVEGYRDVRFRG